MEEIEKRLIDLETKISFQEDLIDTLNTTVYRQQSKIDQLEEAILELVDRMKANEPRLPFEKPPHY